MKLAVFTSLNPVRSGISDYSEALLPELARHFEIDVFIDDYQPSGFRPGLSIRIRNWKQYRPEDFDATLYHIGNNPYHIYMYETVLKHPGIVVLHEYNLHHLIADATIKCGDWDGYLREVEYNGGPKALAYARRVKALQVGPDFEGLPMNRRLLENCRALVVHSRFLVGEIRSAGHEMPIRQIPHGVRIPEVNRNAWRGKLGLSDTNPLIGIFGFMRPHKRIGEALLAMKRLVRVEPRARMVIVGEEHPAFPVRELISHLELDSFVKVLGYVSLEEFEGWMSAVDICLNLRYPSVGETSGTLARALGLGRAVVVSDVGSFSELPDDICLKVPVGDGEENLPIGHRPLRIEEINPHTPVRPEVDQLTDHLLTLTNDPEMADVMGERARSYVATEWTWERVADCYADWIRTVADGREEFARREFSNSLQNEAPEPVLVGVRRGRETGEITSHPAMKMERGSAGPQNSAPSDRHAESVLTGHSAGQAESDGAVRESLGRSRPESAEAREARLSRINEYILGFCHRRPKDRLYVQKHLTRLVHTLEIIPPGSPTDLILEMGAYLHITPALKTKLGYGEVRGAYLGTLGETDHRHIESADGEVFECEIDLFDAEKDPFPYGDESLASVVCCEILEHLGNDPMHMMAEINRILKPGGHLVLSTPNICSLRAVQAILLGYHPGLFHQYLASSSKDGHTDPRHSREYAPRDVQELFEAAGFRVEKLETGPYLATSSLEHDWVKHLVKRYKLPDHLREDVIYAVGTKVEGVRERYPPCLYTGGGEE